ncbi:Uncharacterised protein [Vibrio cholerae]|nr:Uncharacterised protein [Vibrio cholerae]
MAQENGNWPCGYRAQRRCLLEHEYSLQNTGNGQPPEGGRPLEFHAQVYHSPSIPLPQAALCLLQSDQQFSVAG